jgi:RNA polymerase sigma factor (sigma-70 family)
MAADAVQETFVRYAEARLPIREPRGWLFRVAARLAMEWRRTDLRRAKLLAGAPHEALMADPEPRADEEMERREEITSVRAALAALTERDRTVLLLREEGLTHREIAAAVGTTTGSVGTIIARALEKLAVELELDIGEKRL